MRFCWPRATQDCVRFESHFILQLGVVVWQTPTRSSQSSNAFYSLFSVRYLLHFTRWRMGLQNVGDTRRRSQSRTISPKCFVTLTRRGRKTTPTKSVIARHLPNPAETIRLSWDALKRRGRQLQLPLWSEKRYFHLSTYIQFLMFSDSGWWSHHSFAKGPWRELGSWWSSQTFASRGASVVHICSPESRLIFAEFACACVRATEPTWPLGLAHFVDATDVSQSFTL